MNIKAIEMTTSGCGGLQDKSSYAELRQPVGIYLREVHALVYIFRWLADDKYAVGSKV
jgi:hypothetical protein